MDKQVTVIAEAGVNHNGDVNLALKMIDAAAEAGADFVKFQTYSADRLVTQTAPKAKYQIDNKVNESQYQMLKKLEVSEDNHRLLLMHCQKRGIGFLSSAFDIESLNFLHSIGQQLYKIPSGEITNQSYLSHVGSMGGEVILSTGMCTLGEVESAVNTIEGAGTSRDRIIVLHCTSNYPASIQDVNLKVIETMREALGVRTGYSDHTMGIEVSIAAVALGACIIEKHFTLDAKLPGPDQRASLEPHELRDLISAIRNVSLALGDGIKRPSSDELKTRAIVRKSIVASSNIRKGEIFNEHNLALKRPGTGISPMLINELFGKTASRDFEVDELIEI